MQAGGGVAAALVAPNAVLAQPKPRRTVISTAMAVACQAFFLMNSCHRLLRMDKKKFLMEVMMKVTAPPFNTLTPTQLGHQLGVYNSNVMKRKKVGGKVVELLKGYVAGHIFATKHALFLLCKLWYIWKSYSSVESMKLFIQAVPTAFYQSFSIFADPIVQCNKKTRHRAVPCQVPHDSIVVVIVVSGQINNRCGVVRYEGMVDGRDENGLHFGRSGIVTTDDHRCVFAWRLRLHEAIRTRA